MIRSAVRAGYGRIVVWAPRHQRKGTADRRLRRLAREFRHVITVAEDESQWRAAMETLAASDAVTAIGPGTIVKPTGILGDLISWEDGIYGTSKSVFAGGA